MNQITFTDLLSQKVKSDPISFFAHWRERGPLSYIPAPGGKGKIWLILNYEDSVAILHDQRLSKDQRKFLPAGAQNKEKHAAGVLASALENRRDMVRVDPPDHTRLRSLISKSFTPQITEQLRPYIQQKTDELIDAVEPQKQLDMINDFAFPLTVGVLCELLGVPGEDRAQFSSLAHALLTSADETENPLDEMNALALKENLLNYIKDLLDKKRANPGSDLSSRLVEAAETGESVLSEIELISTVWMLINAGYESTANLIGTGMFLLSQHPEQLHQLEQNPALLPEAVEEILRYAAPLSLSTPRWANEDITLNDQLIRKGEQVFVVLIAANTDPHQFVDPARFDVTRSDNRHLAFGRGSRYCLGAPLARLEGQIAIGTLLRRLPTLRLAHEVEALTWTQNLLAHGLTSLPMIF